MPNPNLFKDEKEFMQECMHTTLHKEKKPRGQGLAQCLNMWRNRKRKMARNVISKYLAGNAPDILTCPDCGYNLDNTKRMDPTKNLIKCPRCGEFMYEKVKTASLENGGFDIKDPLLHPEYIADHTHCPVCGKHYKTTCRCRLGNKTCEDKHGWHTCGVHNRVFIGESHELGVMRQGSKCVCPLSEEEKKIYKS
jgi:transcription elongation factor Elf1